MPRKLRRYAQRFQKLGTGLLVILVAGCSTPSLLTQDSPNGSKKVPLVGSVHQNQPITPIQDLTGVLSQAAEESPKDPPSRTVYIRGTVKQQVPLLTGQVYQLEDPTGLIWVLTQDAADPGDELLIKGTVHYERIPIGTGELGEVYVEEEQQLERRTQKTS